MEILVNRKTIRKSRRGLAPLRYEIEGVPLTLRELLLAIVKEEVTKNLKVSVHTWSDGGCNSHLEWGKKEFGSK